MGFHVRIAAEAVTVTLTGWDRLMNGRRFVVIDVDTIRSVGVVPRSSLEGLIDHRSRGCGTHDGSRRPDGRRIGTMIGRSVVGRQFWAAHPSDAAMRLLVLDLQGAEFERVVLAVDDPTTVEGSIRSIVAPT